MLTMLDVVLPHTYSWIRVFGEAIGDVIVFFTAFFVVLNRETMDPGTVGLALSFSLQVNTTDTDRNHRNRELTCDFFPTTDLEVVLDFVTIAPLTVFGLFIWTISHEVLL